MNCRAVVRSCRILALVLIFACNSFANSISFTDSGVGSGTIGSTVFSDAAFTIYAVGDTDNIVKIPGGSGFNLDLSRATILIAGVGKFTLFTPTSFFVNFSLVGFGHAGLHGSDLVNGPLDPQFATWNMRTSIGPITGQGGILQWSLHPLIETSGGTLIFNDGATPLTFKAVVPEPPSMFLVVSGLAGIWGLWLRRECHSSARTG